MRKITIQDVAKELNLSRNTVAKALNNSETVAYETRFMVIKRAWEMGYQKMSPSILGEYKLKNVIDENKTVIVLARRELSVFWNSIIVGISDELNKNGCKLRLNFISEEDESGLVLPRDFSDQIDAIIFMSVFDPRYTELIMKRKLPAVFLDIPLEDDKQIYNGDAIVTEGKNSIRMLTESLIAQGLKRIGFIGDITYCESLKQRYDGFCLAMSNAGLPLDEGIIITKHVADKYYKGYEVEAAIEEMRYIPEAIVCGNDDIALDTIRALKKKGLSVPNDVAVTGFDNEETLTQIEPILTTVAVRNQRLGKRLVQQLLWRLENPDFPKEIVFIETTPIYRVSSKKNML